MIFFAILMLAPTPTVKLATSVSRDLAVQVACLKASVLIRGFCAGVDLLSRDLAVQVSSTLWCLTALFGMARRDSRRGGEEVYPPR